MKLRMLAMAGLATTFAFGACADETTDAPSTGANLTVDYFGDTDVVGFHFDIERVPCGPGDAFTPFSASANVDLHDGIFPGMISLLENNPLDAKSRHLGADFFLSVEPGCYNVTATPASAFAGEAYTASSDCAAASTDPLAPIQVIAGQTTDVPMLVSQCAGSESGAIDTPVGINHPPYVTVEIDEKFNYECEPVQVCATAHDVDDDPIEFAWDKLSGSSIFDMQVGPATVVGFEGGHRIWQQCATIVTRYTGGYDFEVTVYDLAWDAGALVRFEDLTGEDSHASLQFPIYTNWIEEPLCFDAAGDLVSADDVDIVRAPGCSWTTTEQWYCTMADAQTQQLVCPGGNFDAAALYPECD